MKQVKWIILAIAIMLTTIAQGPCTGPEQRVVTIEYYCAQGVDIFWEECYGPGGIEVSLDPAGDEDVQLWARAYDYIGQPYGDPDAWEFNVHDDLGPGGTETTIYSLSDAYAAPEEIRTASDRAGSATLTVTLGPLGYDTPDLGQVYHVYHGPCQ